MTDQTIKDFKDEFAKEPAGEQLGIIRELRDIAINSAEVDVLKAKEQLQQIELVHSQLQELK